jgi:hypothetical protein
MRPSMRFDTLVAEARAIATRLSAHDLDCERVLTSGTITSSLQTSVWSAIGALERAYDELGDEVARRCKFPATSVRYRLPIFPVQAAGQPAGSSELMESLRSVHADLATKVRSHLEVAASDGWLGTLIGLVESPARMNLRRGVATVSFSNGADGMIEMNLRSQTGESIPMLAPVLLQEGNSSLEGTGNGYYLAILPEAREAVSFLDRCVRGMSSLGERVRAELSNFGY